MPKSILIDFEKIKDPFSGLGQFCAHLKLHFDQAPMDIHYWIPGKFKKFAKKIPFILPKSKVFHAVHQDSPFFPWSADTKYVLTIHDLNALHESTSFGSGDFYKHKLQKKIDRAESIVFISEFTRSEVMKEFKIDPTKTQVIYNGISLGDRASVPELAPSKPFLFTVGTVLPKKNFHVLIDLMKLLPDYQLIIAGTTYHSYAQDIKATIEREKLTNRIFLVGTVNEENKLWYYRKAAAFIFPSLLEGFGLPVAEAMSQGLPLFLSDRTSIPEVGGSDAFYFKNFEAAHMKEVFEAGMKSFNEEQKARLIERSKIFDWKKAATEYLKIYSRLLHS
jgi:glycosyltransferase involved in cell wall biosynthesis